MLGRDAVVRKTMLDECKGDRLEEVLAVFSSAVLKKLVAEAQLNNRDQHPAVAQTLALENRGYSGARTELSILLLAHKVSLNRILREKNAARAQFRDFAELLDLKHRGIARRREQVKAQAASCSQGERDVSEDAKLDVWRLVRNNWSGNERWMETLLHGDAPSRKDGLLTAPYDRVWRRMQSGRLTELEDRAGGSSTGLLEQLDSRIRIQRDRLQQWDDFRRRMFGSSAQDRAVAHPLHAAPLQARREGIDLGFGAHEMLYPGRLSPKKLPIKRAAARLEGGYGDLLEGLQRELGQINKGSSTQLAAALRERKTQAPQPASELLDVAAVSADEPISELSDLDEEAMTAGPTPSGLYDAYPKGLASGSKDREQHHIQMKKDVASDAARLDQGDSENRGSRPLLRSSSVLRPKKPSKIPPAAPREFSPPRLQLHSPPISPLRSPVRTPSPQRSPPRYRAAAASAAVTSSDTGPRDPAPLQSPDGPASPTQALADQIIASMNNASPSPIKKPRHTLSLAERTRLSMARGPRSAKLDEEDYEPDLERLSIRRHNSSSNNNNAASVGSTGHSHSYREQQQQNESHEEYEDLVSRTRKSMVGLEAAKQKAQLERRRSQRKSRQISSAAASRREGSSYFPTVDEGDSTLLLAEELMSGEQDDAEAIFKSRPKLKTSPVPSPTRL